MHLTIDKKIITPPLDGDRSSQRHTRQTLDYDNSMTGHSYGNRNFDQIFSANEAQDNENEKDLDICFVEHIDENFTGEISSTNNVHKDKQ